MNTERLLDKLSQLTHLNDAWHLLQKNPTSHGISGETISEFSNDIQSNLVSICDQLKQGTYKFSPSRPYIIPKSNGKFRPLQIPEVRDRVVLKGIALLLEKQLEDLLAPGIGVSYAYEKGKGIQDAVLTIKNYYDNGYKYIFEADIVDFFGTVNQSDLLKVIFGKLPDSSLNQLISNGISIKVDNLDSIPAEQRYLFKNNGGLPQGNSLSPLFSNIYLGPFDQEMKDKGYRLVRYADDFVIMASSIEEAKVAYVDSKKFLKENLNLEIHELSENSKTRIIDPTSDTFSFLSISFDGKMLFPSIEIKNKFIDTIFSLCSANNKSNILKTLVKIKNSHEGWISNFIFCDVKRYFTEIDMAINIAVYDLLKKCGWKFQRKTLGHIPMKKRKIWNRVFESGECLSVDQRNFSGIPHSRDLYNERITKRDKKLNSKANNEKKKQSNQKQKTAII